MPPLSASARTVLSPHVLLWVFAVVAALALSLSSQASWQFALDAAGVEAEQMARANSASLALVVADVKRTLADVAAFEEAAGGEPGVSDGRAPAEWTEALTLRLSGRERLERLSADGRRLIRSNDPEGFSPEWGRWATAGIAAASSRAGSASVGPAHRRGAEDWLPTRQVLADGDVLVLALPVDPLVAGWTRPEAALGSRVQLESADGQRLLSWPGVATDGPEGPPDVMRSTGGGAPHERSGHVLLAAATPEDSDRVAGWARVPGSDLRVTVQVDVDGLWSRWMHQTGRFVTAVGILLLLMLGVGVGALGRMSRAVGLASRAQAEERAARLLVRQALDASRDAIWRMDAQGVLHFQGDLAPLMGGVAGTPPRVGATGDTRSRSDLRWLLDRTAAADRVVIEKAVQRTAERGEALSVLFQATGLDGQSRHYLLKGATTAGGEGGTHAVGTLRDVSSLVRAQADADDTDRTLQRLCDYAAIGPWTADMASGRLTLSDAARRICRLPPGAPTPDWIGFGITRADHQAELAEARLRLLTEGRPYDLVLPIDGPAGTTRWIRSVATIQRANGVLQRVEGAVQDVTRLVQVQTALTAVHQRERWLAVAAGRSSSLILVTDPEQRILWCNRSFLDRSGYGMDEVLGRRPAELLQRGELSDRDRWVMSGRAATGEGFGPDRLVNHARDGQRYWIDLSVQPIRNEAGGLECFVEIQNDVTADIEREQALREVMRRFEQATHSGRIGVWEHRYADDHTQWNAVMFDLFSLDDRTQPVTTALFLGSLHPDDARDQGANYLAAIADPSQAQWTGEFRVRCKADWRWIRAMASFDRDPSGLALRGVGTMVDVTAERRLQEEQVARAAAEARSQAQGAFVSRMSHELRTPLHAVIGHAQLMASGSAVSAAASRHLQQIERSAWHLLALIDDLLDLSRVETGTIRTESVPVALAPVVDDVAEMAVPLAERQAITLKTEVQAGAVLGDPTRLRQVLINLISNAIKYGRPGGSVTLRAQRRGTRVELQVQDDGLGMAPEQLARLFQPFERLGRERSGIEGTGIGMTISQALVERMGGRIHVESEVGRGTCVTLDFVAAEAVPEEASATAKSTAPLLSAASGDGPALRVLCVDDSEVNALLLEGTLARLRPDWVCRTAATLAEARSLLEAERFDLLFLDFHLPDGSGLDLLAGLPGPRVAWSDRTVLLTADATERARTAAADSGIRLLVKPFRLQDLELLLTQLEERLD